MRVLAIGVSEISVSRLAAALRSSGLFMDRAAKIAEADLKQTLFRYDCLIVSRVLPDGDGTALIRNLRGKGTRTPVLLLAPNNTAVERIEGFVAGADDCVSVPLAMAEVVARVLALCRRKDDVLPSQLRLGDLALDLSGRRVARSEMPITLSPREFAVLELLAIRSEQVVTRADLIECCWDEMADPRSNMVDALMARLRKRLGPPPIVESVWGVGFRLTPHVTQGD
ncbi:response regulator transcription factor [Streptomyces sp. NBC_00988]|uniref:winged helix-turn-helix domain-containing protein n=1 Tax=Streptomyces sp. NBC_00988 TaxID=2903704 RepID=UPI00386CC284|nr:response regulator transcription factor [Streptomyces sp. NBC_00988]